MGGLAQGRSPPLMRFPVPARTHNAPLTAAHAPPHLPLLLSLPHPHPPLASRIKYMRIYEDDSLTFGLFCFPAGATIPLHNHPGMTVFSR